MAKLSRNEIILITHARNMPDRKGRPVVVDVENERIGFLEDLDAAREAALTPLRRVRWK